MRSNKVLGILLIMATAGVNAQKVNFKTDPTTGVEYYFVKHAKVGAKVADTMFAKVVMVYKDEKDSVLLDTHKKGGDSTGTLLQGIPLKKSFNGSLEQALQMMSPGDSAIFKINADSLYLKTFHAPADKLPPNITSKTFYTFYIKLTKFETMKGMMEDRQRASQQAKGKVMQRKSQESVDIASYLKKNYPGVKPNADSLYILSKTNGNGKQIMEGDSVEIAYAGTLLDGTTFDKSRPGEGLKFVFTKNMSLIHGWLAILPTLKEGDKVKVLIPSSLGYGSNGMGQAILPYTPLVFDMEVLHAGSHK